MYIVKIGLINAFPHQKNPRLNRAFFLFVINKYLEDKNLKEFNLEDFINSKYSPLKIYNLTQSSLYAYLDELKNTGLISIVKTAGLNTIKLNKELTVEELYE